MIGKDLYHNLIMLIEVIEWDIRPDVDGKLTFWLDVPSISRFDEIQQNEIEKALEEFLTDYAKPMLEEALKEYEGTAVNENFPKLIKGYIFGCELVKIHEGERSIKDEIRHKLGLLPNFERLNLKHSMGQ